jgi:starvation-inducible DNA-binding protein
MSDKNHQVVKTLSVLLADSYLLMLKTHNYHWNVTGPHFSGLHTMFQGQYEELFAAVDEMAERLRALGEKAPGSFADFTKLSKLKEETGHPAANDMIQNLADDHETLAADADALLKAATEVGDDATGDLAVQRLQLHQKTVWMLKAHLAA